MSEERRKAIKEFQRRWRFHPDDINGIANFFGDHQNHAFGLSMQAMDYEAPGGRWGQGSEYFRQVDTQIWSSQHSFEEAEKELTLFRFRKESLREPVSDAWIKELEARIVYHKQEKEKWEQTRRRLEEELKEIREEKQKLTEEMEECIRDMRSIPKE